MPFRFLLPNVPILNPINSQAWTLRFKKYAALGDSPIVKSDCPGTKLPILHIGSAQAARTINVQRRTWIKPVEMYQVLSWFGPNLGESVSQGRLERLPDPKRVGAMRKVS